MVTIKHEHDARIDGLYQEIQQQREVDTVRVNGEHVIKAGPYLKELRAERIRLIAERWKDLLSLYGDPRSKSWPKKQVEWRGQPVAPDRNLKLYEVCAGELGAWAAGVDAR